MTPTADSWAGLPHTDDLRHPATWMLDNFRWFGDWGVSRRYDVQVRGAAFVPATGPVIFCSNHIGVIDGPLLAIYAPRPVHALTKSEMFVGKMGRFLLQAGQIPLHRGQSDPYAVRVGLKVLRAGHALGIYPEGARGGGEFERFEPGAAYFALVTGAPVVPVLMFGSRHPGQGRDDLPPKGSRIDMVFGEPFQVPAQPWPRTREQVGHVSKLLKEHMLVHLDRTRASTGLELPGPLPH